jgi:hypothetical protein
LWLPNGEAYAKHAVPNAKELTDSKLLPLVFHIDSFIALPSSVPLSWLRGATKKRWPRKDRTDLIESVDADPRTKDYALDALNTPCSKAMHAAFEYARWVANDCATTVDGLQKIEGGFDKMPEVRAHLESRLVPNDPGGFALRATFGWHLSLIDWIDHEWLEHNVARIWDLEVIENDPKVAYGWAAWNMFLRTAQPNIEYYRLLRSQFGYAVDQASQVQENDQLSAGPFGQLSEHLVILYGRGQLALDDDGAILKRLLTKAKPAIRIHAMEFIGLSLWREKVNLPTDAQERLMALWDWYWTHGGEVDAKTDPTSHTFGYWFVCDTFDSQWALDRLEQFVTVVPKPDPSEEIAAILAKIATIDLARALRILRQLIVGDDENWRVYSWRSHAQRILATGIAGNANERDQAIEIVHYLGKRGFVEFRDLLPN